MSFLRVRNRYDPSSTSPFKLSRSKLEFFLNCPRCFYLDRRMGVVQPPTPPFNLNNAVDHLLKKEFDEYRVRGIPHPLMVENGIEAVPFLHEKLDHWRDALRGGIEFHHKPSNFVLTGGVDDLWVDARGRLIIVDYKATSKKESVNLEAPWQISYKRQMDMYAWLFRANGFQVAPMGYFVYCNALTVSDRFDRHLEFDVSVLPYSIQEEWVEGALLSARECLIKSEEPPYTRDCKFCEYQQALSEVHQQMKFNLDV